jgi:hypothetical protein
LLLQSSFPVLLSNGSPQVIPIVVGKITTNSQQLIPAGGEMMQDDGMDASLMYRSRVVDFMPSGTRESAIPIWHQPNVELSVSIQGGPGWAHDSVIRAMTEWDLQEAVFIKEYYPNESYALAAACAADPTPVCVQGSGSNAVKNSFVFYEDEGAADPMVTVLFSPVHSEQIATIELVSLTSELAITGFDGSRFTISVLSALTSVPDNATSRDVLYRIMLHEFGHVMGLGHIYDGKDIMDGTAYFIYDPARNSYISTVDLYTIRELAELGGGSLRGMGFMLLPASIPCELINVD